MPEIDDLIVGSVPEGFPAEGTWQYKVLMALAERGTQGATDLELTDILQAPGGQSNLRPRRIEMERQGFVVDSGTKRPTPSGSRATVWLLSSGLRAVLWPRFHARDCEHLGTVDGMSWAQLTGAQRDRSNAIRMRMALLTRQGGRTAADEQAPLVARVSGPEQDGRAAGILAGSLSLSAEWDERVALVVQLSVDGLEIALRLAAAEAEDVADEERERRNRLRSRLASLPAAERQVLQGLVEDAWSPLLVDHEGTEREGADLEEWLTEISAEPSNEALLARRWAPDELGALGHAAGEAVQELARLAAPVLAFLAASLGDPVLKLTELLYWPEDRAKRLVALAGRSRQLLFAGPPGTGKTLTARTLAAAMTEEGNARLVQFHPTYAYEDFVEGIRPVLHAPEVGPLPEAADEHEDPQAEERVEVGGLQYQLRWGVFRQIVCDAMAAPDVRHFLVIDEINRANLPRVLGELLFALEYRGAGNEVTLPYSGDRLAVPENLWVIGTMNTADRSVALMDAAMRRRFKEFRFDVDYDAVRAWHTVRTTPELGDEAADRLGRLNAVVIELLDDDRAIGHSFLMRADLAEVGFETVWDEDLEPVLRDHLLGRTDELDDLRDAFLQ